MMGFDNHAKIKVMCSSDELGADFLLRASDVSSQLPFIACELVHVMGFHLGSLADVTLTSHNQTSFDLASAKL